MLIRIPGRLIISNFKRNAAIGAVLLLVGLAYYSYTWGVWNYVFSVSGNIAPSPNARRSDDTYFKAESPKGNVLLMHGLNFDASKLHDLAGVFLAQNHGVLVPRLSGHRGAMSETLIVPTEIWLKQVEEWQAGLEKPLVCAGYSLGGLLVTERYLKGALDCEKFVLFAPAFALRTPNSVAKFFRAMMPSSFTVPSGIPHAYMHFDHPGIGPTFAATQLVESLHMQLLARKDKAMPPGLVFMDPRDQVIGPLKVRMLIEENFPDWKIVDVEAVNLNENHAFHLIIDEPHVGTEQWRKISAEIATFLKR